MSTYYSNYSRTSLWHGVNVFPENFNTNVIPCLLQLKPKSFLWMYIRSVQSFQLALDLLDGVEVQTLKGQVHHFQCSSRFLPSQVVRAIVCFIGIVMANLTKRLKPFNMQCSNNCVCVVVKPFHKVLNDHFCIMFCFILFFYYTFYHS